MRSDIPAEDLADDITAKVTIDQRMIPVDDGHELFVRRIGPALPSDLAPVVCCNGVGVSTFFYEPLERALRHRRRVLRWDYRGHGRSAPMTDPKTLTIEQTAEDLRAVLDDARIDRAVLVGHSMGCQVIMEFERRHPDRVAGLIPMLGTHGRPLDTFFSAPIFTKVAFRALFEVANRKPHWLNDGNALAMGNPWFRSLAGRLAGLSGVVNGGLMPAPMIDAYLHHMARLDARVFFNMCRWMAFHSVEDHLEQVAAPTLVVAGTHDYFTPLWLSEEMADRVPGAELLVVPGGSHAALVEQPELVNLRIEAFLDKRVDAPRSDHTDSSREETGGAVTAARGARSRPPSPSPSTSKASQGV